MFRLLTLFAVLTSSVVSDASSAEHARLLYAQQTESDCVIGNWDSRVNKTTILARIDQCPEDLYVSDDGSEVLVVDDDTLLLSPVDGSGPTSAVALPDMAWRSWVGEMELRPDTHPTYLPSLDDMKSFAAGRQDDGALLIATSVWMPADDEYHYVFRRDQEEWTIVESRHCGRWGCEEPLASLQGRSTNIWTWPEERRVWNERLADNPFLSSRQVDSENAVHTLTFAIDGKESTLRAYTRPSAHFDLIYTSALELQTGNGPFVNLSKNQCATSIVGRFLLVMEFFQGRFEVTDLGTGETMIGDLKAAMWLD